MCSALQLGLLAAQIGGLCIFVWSSWMMWRVKRRYEVMEKQQMETLADLVAGVDRAHAAWLKYSPPS